MRPRVNAALLVLKVHIWEPHAYPAVGMNIPLMLAKCVKHATGVIHVSLGRIHFLKLSWKILFWRSYWKRTPLLNYVIVCIGVSNPPQKHHPLFLAKPPPPLNLQTVQPPSFEAIPTIYWFFVNVPSAKNGIFQWAANRLLPKHFFLQPFFPKDSFFYSLLSSVAP